MGFNLTDIKSYVDDKISQAISRIIHYTFYTSNSSSGEKDGVACDHSDSNAPSYLVRRMQHFGFRSIPPAGVEAIRLSPWMAAGNSVVVAEESSRFGPSDLADGEAALFNSITGVVLKLASDGSINIIDKEGGKVTVDGTGNVVSTPKSGKNVLLGASSAAEKVVLGTTYRNAEHTLNVALNTYLGALSGFFTALSGATTVANVAAAGAAVITPTGTFVSALLAFETNAATYLSNVTKTV